MGFDTEVTHINCPSKTMAYATPKEIGSLSVENSEEVKHTNEIKIAIPLLDAIDIQVMDISADALLTQRQLAEYLVTEQKASLPLQTGKADGFPSRRIGQQPYRQ
jgi:hypothetical protein